MKLTERKIEKLAIGHGRKDRLVFEDEQHGLAVRVTASGGRTYLCQYTLRDHKWRVPLGAPSSALAKAREAAAAVIGDIAKGRNPTTATAERIRRARNPPYDCKQALDSLGLDSVTAITYPSEIVSEY